METIEKSSGNIFADLGLPNPEERLMKAELARQINKIIDIRKLKQADAARILGIEETKISHLKNGRLSEFSIERLFSFLLSLDSDIEIVVRHAKNGRKKQRITVTAEL